MKYRYLLFFTIFSFSFYIFSSKISALTITECQYSNDINLLLPVTVGVEIRKEHNFYPFSEIKPTTEIHELVVHNEKTCEISFPHYQDSFEYTYSYNYYYQYNNEKISVPFLGGGHYSELDITKPNIYSYWSNPFTAQVGTLLDLETISNLVAADDERDGRIIPEIIFDNYSDNYNKLGEYSIIFSACDNSNNCSELIFKVKVVDTISPTITGPNEITTYLSSPLKLNDLTYLLKATDNYDGNISDKISLVSSNYDYNHSGEYYAQFTIADSSNNKLKENFNLKINLLDDIAPSIEGPTVINSNLSSPMQIDDIISQLIITDNEDKFAHKNVYILSDKYSNNRDKIGSYKIVVGSFDKYGNESLPYIIDVNVIDDVSPTIDGENLYETYLSSPISLLNIKSNLIVHDNYDGNLINKTEILNDNYSINKDKIGIYYITFIVTDSSNNPSEPFIIEIQLYDDVSPTIEGENLYTSLSCDKLNIDIIKANLTATDNHDGNLSDGIEVNDDFYTINHNIPGNYFITFYVIDKSGNMSNLYKVKIIVEEEISYLKSLDNSYLYFDDSTLINDEEIFNILSINTNDYNKITTLENTYINSYDKEGNYKIIYQLEDTDYTVSTLSLNINVKEAIKGEEKIIQEEKQKKKETIFTKIISFFRNIFTCISNFFKRLFR